MSRHLFVFMFSAALAMVTLNSHAIAQQKTVKACQDEWRANKAANQASGVTLKAYVAECRGGASAQPTAVPASGTAAPRTSPTQATGGQKTVKACQDEWRANKAANQASGVTLKAYVAECRGGASAQPTAVPAPGTAAPQTGPTQATGGQKTVKACQDEWRANKAANQASGVTLKAYVAECRGGSAPTQSTVAPSPPVAPAPAPTPLLLRPRPRVLLQQPLLGVGRRQSLPPNRSPLLRPSPPEPTNFQLRRKLKLVVPPTLLCGSIWFQKSTTSAEPAATELQRRAHICAKPTPRQKGCVLQKTKAAPERALLGDAILDRIVHSGQSARTRWPVDAQNQSRRNDRAEMNRTALISAAPVGRQGPPTRAAAPAMTALRDPRGSLLSTTGTAPSRLTPTQNAEISR